MRAPETELKRDGEGRRRERGKGMRDKTKRFEWKKEQRGTWNGVKGRKRRGKGTGHTNESDEDL